MIPRQGRDADASANAFATASSSIFRFLIFCGFKNVSAGNISVSMSAAMPPLLLDDDDDDDDDDDHDSCSVCCP